MRTGILAPIYRRTYQNEGCEFVRLRPRELDLARLVGEGYSNKEISARAGISTGTVKVYLSHFYQRMGINNRVELALWAARNLPAPKKDNSKQLRVVAL